MIFLARRPASDRSATARTRPKTISVAAMIRRSRSEVSMVCWKAAPRTQIGSDPTMTNHPVRAFGSLRRSFTNSDAVQALTIAAMSLRK